MLSKLLKKTSFAFGDREGVQSLVVGNLGVVFLEVVFFQKVIDIRDNYFVLIPLKGKSFRSTYTSTASADIFMIVSGQEQEILKPFRFLALTITAPF